MQTPQEHQFSIRLNSQWMIYGLFALIFLQVLIHTIALVNWHLGGIRNDFTILFVKFFDLSGDSTIPTWFSSALLFLCFFFLFLTYLVKAKYTDKYKYYWLSLAAIFLIFSVDEVATMHEVVGETLSGRFLGETTGFLYYGWVVFGSIFVGLFALTYFRFFRALPKKTSVIMVAALTIFFVGALGVEAFNGRYSELHDSWSLGYALGTALEESLEMIGVTLFLWAIIDHLQTYTGCQNFELRLGS